MLDLQTFEREGFTTVKPFLSVAEVGELIRAVERHAKPSAGRGGTRDVAHLAPELAVLAEHLTVRRIVDDVLGKGAFAVRATLFDKSDTANWKVPWHQDVTIALVSKQEVPGYGPWSVKSGVVHVQPPADVLQRMVTVRIHLDACPHENGALRVMPGSHLLGKLNQNTVAPHVDEGRAVWCEVESGGALIMRPLLLHASSVAKMPTHRRVVHFDFAIGELEGGLEWLMRKQH